MLLFAIILAFFAIPNQAVSNPPKLSEIPFKQPQYFIPEHQRLYDDIHFVFDKILEKENSTAGSTIDYILEDRLIQLIENPNFELTTLGLNSFNKSIKRNHESLAIAIWPHLKKYKNESSDLQLEVCSNNIGDIMQKNMLQLLTKMVADRPDCLQQVTKPIRMALDNQPNMIVFLNDHGVEITVDDLHLIAYRGCEDIFEWAVRKYPSFLLQSISEGYRLLSIRIWKFLKRENYSNQLLQICNETIIHAVNSNLDYLVEIFHKDFPECILSKGDILMDIAIRGGINKDSMISFLNERGLEITPGIVLRDPIYRSDCGFQEMILLLNDIGVKITPEHLQHLSTYEDTSTFKWAHLNTHLSKETFINSPIKNDYFERAILKMRFDLIKKILDFNVFGIEEIERVMTHFQLDKDCLDLLQNYVSDKKLM